MPVIPEFKRLSFPKCAIGNPAFQNQLRIDTNPYEQDKRQKTAAMPIQPDIQKQLYELVNRSSTLAFVTSDRESGGITGLVPGDRVVAEVLYTLPDSRVQVQLGNMKLNLNIPIEVRPGQNLDMTFVSEEPRPAFVIPRQDGESRPAVTFSDASRLLAILAENENISDPSIRASLQSINGILRSTPGNSNAILSTLMDEALTYGRKGESPALQPAPRIPVENAALTASTLPSSDASRQIPERMKLDSFETGAARILGRVADNARFTIVEAANNPVTPLPLAPGDEVDGVVTGGMPDGKAFVRIAGSHLELPLPRSTQTGDLLRLTFIGAYPKPLFGIPNEQKTVESPGLSDTAKWMSQFGQSGRSLSPEQLDMLNRLERIITALPKNSPAFAAILDDPMTYESAMPGRVDSPSPELSLPFLSAAAAGHTRLANAVEPAFSSAMLKLLDALFRGNRLALLEALDQIEGGFGFSPGEHMRGEVTASLGNGRFLVQMGIAVFEFIMPKGVKKGDKFNFFFISDDPKPTFLMTRSSGAGEARVSETGKWASALAELVSEKSTESVASGLTGRVLDSPPRDAAEVSGRLQRGISGSGIFYESHLARWFGGEYELEEIMKEPQAKLLGHTSSSGREDMETLTGVLRSLVQEGTREAAEHAVRLAISAGKDESLPVKREGVRLVREQLETLRSGEIMYRGELFPGQNIEWRIAERDAGKREKRKSDRKWESGMELELPLLGKIGVKISLDRKSLTVAIEAADPSTAERLENGKERLAGQLEAAGLPASAIGVRHAEKW